MKMFSFLFLLLFPVFLKAQTKILDSRVDWGSGPTLYVFLSGDDVDALELKIGTVPGDDDLLNEEYAEGTDFTITDNVIQIPLSGVTASGDRFVWLNVVRSNSTAEDMAYQAN